MHKIVGNDFVWSPIPWRQMTLFVLDSKFKFRSNVNQSNRIKKFLILPALPRYVHKTYIYLNQTPSSLQLRPCKRIETQKIERNKWLDDHRLFRFQINMFHNIISIESEYTIHFRADSPNWSIQHTEKQINTEPCVDCNEALSLLNSAKQATQEKDKKKE